ncbi:MAG: DUF2795 domain-containing protein [Methanosarcina flavescens]|uniref:DUF2795 domain-containing protein n=1 Tax=Methanosarcina flavescens TaxID=1715806 RepID=A0A660HVE8_9EURY|nr:DUF2795 domain-containing protein [Methanosarcina flavescens]AYK16273.1 DUF2795 domain-containing protein [Methanosarcina flavescens]NLK33155.1 DUF2795 domain-containing protein [Methanosarcina flavescens]
MDYPVIKKQFIENVKKHDASSEVIECLEDLPDKECTNAADVSEEFEEK